MVLDTRTEPIKLDDAAAYLKLHYMTVRKLAITGQLRASQIGGKGGPWRTTIADCDRFLGSTTEPTLPSPRQRPPGEAAAIENLKRRGIFKERKKLTA